MSSSGSSESQTTSSTTSNTSTGSSTSIPSTTPVPSTTSSSSIAQSTSRASSSDDAARSATSETSAPPPTSGTIESSSSASSISPISTPASDPSVTTPPRPFAFKVIISLGECAGLGLPKVLQTAGLTQVDLEVNPLSNGLYTTTLTPNEVGGEAQIYLEDDGERCGPQGACVNLHPYFEPDPGRMSVQVTRVGDLGKTMYPFSAWMDGGRLYDNTPADSQANKYNCWGWSDEDCPFAYTNVGDPVYALSSSTLNATIHITFCPVDGPSVSSIGPNTKPYDSGTTIIATGIVVGTESIVPISTVLTPLSTTRPHMSLMGSKPTPITSEVPPASITPAPDDTDGWDPDRDSTSTGTCVKIGNIRCGYTQVVVGKTTTVPMGNPVLMPLPTNSETSSVLDIFPTYFIIATTTAIPGSTTAPIPIPTRVHIKESSGTSSVSTSIAEVSKLLGPGLPFALVPIPTTFVDSLGVPIATSTISAAVVPTFSTVTDNRGSAISTVAFNLTTTVPVPSPTPPPESLVTLTSWTTYMTVNGSTVPALGAQVGVLTTVSETYILDPSSTIPLSVYSSISARSVQTSLPSGTSLASADTTSNKRASTVAAAIVGSLVGITLLSVFLWIIWVKRRRQQRRAPDYVGYQSPAWGPGSVNESGSQESVLDLNSEPQPTVSVVEPWVERREPPPMSRKMQREMEERGEGLAVAGPSHYRTATQSSSSRVHNTTRPSKSPNRVPSQLAETSTRSPAHSNALLSQSSQGSRHSSPSPVPVPLPVQPPPPQSPPPPPPPSIYARYQSEQVQDTAIPPRYNEAWNIQRPPSSE